MERQASALPAQRGKRQHFASVGEKVGEKERRFHHPRSERFAGRPGKLKLIVQLTDTGERAMLSKDKPFRRTDGYSAT